MSKDNITNSPVLNVIEYFESWQGEGPNQGKLATFIRFPKCNLNCPFCDTKEKMKVSNQKPVCIEDILVSISRTNYLVITGGEPTLKDYIQPIINVLSLLKRVKDLIIGIETNGSNLSRFLSEFIDTIKDPKFNLEIYWSPKICRNKDDITAFANTRIFFLQTLYCITDIVQKLDNVDLFIKTVIDDYIDYDFILSCAKSKLHSHNLYVMPQGVTKQEIFDNCVKAMEVAKKYGTNISTRAHILGLFE